MGRTVTTGMQASAVTETSRFFEASEVGIMVAVASNKRMDKTEAKQALRNPSRGAEKEIPAPSRLLVNRIGPLSFQVRPCR
jgi:hypothetical protein